MKVLIVGGGTAGHITPSVAVAEALKQRDASTQIVYVIEKDAKFAHLLDNQPAIDKVVTVSAGKLRRYHGESWLRRVFDLKTLFLNIRDVFRTLAGIHQARQLLKAERPDVVFIKGGFVGVPVGIEAGRLGIPYLTHDSDAHPGLANHLIAKKAAMHATGMPAKFYPQYETDRVRYVGVPLDADFVPVTPEKQQDYRRLVGLPKDGLVLLITGGSQGASVINQTVVALAPLWLASYPQLTVVHQVGKGNLDLYPTPVDRLVPSEFLTPMYAWSGAADLIITRAGSTINELAAQGKACIVIPNPLLTGGHQLKNAQHLEEQGAAISIPDPELTIERLDREVRRLLDHPDACRQLATKLHGLAKPHAAQDVAELITQLVKPVA